MTLVMVLIQKSVGSANKEIIEMEEWIIMVPSCILNFIFGKIQHCDFF